MAQLNLFSFKRCSKCGLDKPLTEFCKNRGNKDGLSGQCRLCRAASERARHERDPEAYKARARKNQACYKSKPEAQEKAREYRRKNKDKISDRCRQWAKDHPERARAATRKWTRNNPDHSREYRRKNRERIDAQIAAWRAANPECRTVYNQRRRARIKQAEGDHTFTEIRQLLEDQGWKCANPHCCADLREVDPEIDHKVSLTNGGANSVENLHWLCAPCNRRKFTHDWDDWLILEEARTRKDAA